MKNEHCNNKSNFDKVTFQTKTYEEAQKLFLDEKGFKHLINTDFTDLCEDKTHKIKDVIVMPFSQPVRGQFTTSVCKAKNSFIIAAEKLKNFQSSWSIECVVSDCDGDVFKSFRIEYVNYCLSFSK